MIRFMEKIEIRNEKVEFVEEHCCVKLNMKFFLNDNIIFLASKLLRNQSFTMFHEYLYTQGELMLDYYANYI